MFSFGNKSFLGKITFADKGLDVVFFGAESLKSRASGLGLALLVARPRPRTEAGVWLGLAVVPGAGGAEPRDLNLDLDLDFIPDLPVPVSAVSGMLLLSLRGEVTAAALSLSTLNVFLSFLSRSLFGLILLRGILARDLVTLEAGASVLTSADLAWPRPLASCVLRLGTLAWVTPASVVSSYCAGETGTAATELIFWP